MFESFDFSSFAFGALVITIALSFQKSTVHLVFNKPLPLKSQNLFTVVLALTMLVFVFDALTEKDFDGIYVPISLFVLFLRLLWLSKKAPLNSSGDQDRFG